VIFRAIAGVMLAIFIAGPASRAECLLSCAEANEPATPATCHDEPADGASIGQAHACAAAAPAVLTAVKRAGTDLLPSLVAVAPIANVVGRRDAPARRHHGPPGPAPLASLLIPLRI
jgi:hypothetical protein